MRKCVLDSKKNVVALIPFSEPQSKEEQKFYQKQREFVMRKYKFVIDKS